MPQLKILGSCSGTEPMPNRHHTSIAMTINGRCYFFDAGENAAHTAYTEGIDLTKIRAIFISHTHYDHIEGLMGLFWTIKKHCSRYKTNTAESEIKLFIPEIKIWEKIYDLLNSIDTSYAQTFEITADAPKIGSFYRDENIEVSAFESHHLPLSEDGRIRSFSYKIIADGKTTVFSGDVKDMNDLIEPLREGCDLLLCETGHHQVKTVCEFAEAHNVKRLVFVHHGREILEDRDSVKEAIEAARIPVEIAFDGMEINV